MSGFEEEDYIKKFDIGLWKKIFIYMKSNNKNMIQLLILNIGIAFFDVGWPIITMFAINNFIIKNNITYLPLFIVVYIFIFVIQAGCIYLFIRMAGKLEVNIVHDIRTIGFKKLQELSFSYYDTTPVGFILARMTSDAQRIGDFIAWSFIDVFWSVSIVILVTINMLILNYKLALCIIALMPILIFISYFFQVKILKGHRKTRKINSSIVGSYNESISGAKTTKTLVREDKNFEEFEILSSKMRKSSIKVLLLSSIYLPIVSIVGSFAIALVIGVGGNELLNGTITIAVLTVFINYSIQMFEPIKQIAKIFSELQSAQASAERIFTLIETKSEIVDSKEIIKIYGDAFHPIKKNWPSIKGNISFKNVSFSYKSGEKVLEEFNLEIKAGEKIALVGETGAGKSTIVNLICRFYEPTTGKILIDGVDYKERSQIWLQSHLGYVLQSPHLFSGTIMENIRYGNLDATDEQIIEVSKKVNAYDFIMQTEKGFLTDVGEGGNRISSGQKQLISFARAIIGNPSIFILDEATSSVDTETEQDIQEAVYEALEGRTSFIVAHRLSTIRYCDKILVIQEGKIIESGNHKELLKQKGYYYKLYTNQFVEEEENKLGISSSM